MICKHCKRRITRNTTLPDPEYYPWIDNGNPVNTDQRICDVNNHRNGIYEDYHEPNEHALVESILKSYDL